MKLIFFTALITLVCFGWATSAVSVAQERIGCTSGNALIFGDCMKKREQTLRARMVTAFNKALGHPSEQVKQYLRDEQEVWNDYLDKACAYFLDTPSFGREGEIYHYQLCRTRIIEDRAKKLEGLFSPCGSRSC